MNAQRMFGAPVKCSEAGLFQSEDLYNSLMATFPSPKRTEEKLTKRKGFKNEDEDNRTPRASGTKTS